ncbi:MAG: cytochrome c5 family protein [Halioglobus sp.]
MFLSRKLLIALCAMLYPATSFADYPIFSDDRLTLGRSIWLENCEGCHAYGIAGAPLATSKKAWSARIEKGKTTLYLHAIEGFFGPGGTMMPARGGNDSLTDREVSAAVDYMILLATDD